MANLRQRWQSQSPDAQAERESDRAHGRGEFSSAAHTYNMPGLEFVYTTPESRGEATSPEQAAPAVTYGKAVAAHEVAERAAQNAITAWRQDPTPENHAAMLEMYSKSGEAARAHYAARDQMEAATMPPSGRGSIDEFIEKLRAEQEPLTDIELRNAAESQLRERGRSPHAISRGAGGPGFGGGGAPLSKEDAAAHEAYIQAYKDAYRAKQAQAEKALQTGARGGKFYVSATGAKVYVKPNPGVELLGTVQPTPFVSGLPQSVSLNQPNTGAGVQQSMMFGNRPR